jgi:DNA-binding response OmpR family regulator
MMADDRNPEDARGRVLVVEDDYFIASDVRDSLEEMGCDVVGPYATIEEATAAMESESLDAAVLDVNLSGDAVYPLAGKLMGRRVPLLFVTGYSPEIISQKFAAVPRLTKPIMPRQLQKAVALLIADHQGDQDQSQGRQRL